MNRKDKRYFSFIPIPALVVIILALYLVIKPSLFYEPSWLLPITNTVFVTVVFFVVTYIAMRNYKATGRIQILLLGCGVFAFGIGGVVAGFVRSIPGAGANLNVTIYNTGALIGAIFHFAAALILLGGIFPEVRFERREFWLVFSYMGLIIFMSLFTVASLGGITPPFFIQGIGPTALRQWVLGSANILFAFSFLIFMGSYLRSREVFLYWYSSALALTSISLTAFFIESAVGSPIGWAGRFSQYLGGVYFLIAVITAARSAQIRRTSFDYVLTASLSPAEEKFRALAEHSPDMIERFDRDLKHIYVNQAGVRLHGKPAGSIIGKTTEEAKLPGADVSLLKERIQRVFETAQPVEVELYISTKNGARFYQSHCVPEFGVDGTVVNVLVVSRDLTERKRADEQLRATLESIGDGFFACDLDWRFVYVNAPAERILGIRREEVLGKSHWEVFPLTLGTPLEHEYRRAAAGEIRNFENFYEPWGRWFHNRCFPREGGGMSVYFQDITERKRIEEELRKYGEELEMRVQERTKELGVINEALKAENEERLRVEIELRESESQLRQLSNALLSAQEKERKMIAQEIHDGLGASLAAAKFQVESTLNQIGDGNSQAKVALERIIPIVQGTIEEARRIQMSLRPSILDDLGILPTINWFCRQFESTYSNIRIKRKVDIQEHEVPEFLKIVIYRILQEALNNIAKHSKASVVLFDLTKINQAIQLVIRDSGQGFDLKEAYSRKDATKGLGLDSMRERTELSGGSFLIKSSKGAGTVIRATWLLNS